MPPNILFAFADDWGRYASAYRPFEGENAINALIDTPNFDRVAEGGGAVLGQSPGQLAPRVFRHGWGSNQGLDDSPPRRRRCTAPL